MAVKLLVLICSFKIVFGEFEGFIVGGDYVDSIKEFPHVAFLSISSNDGDMLICGSSILNQVILITAAHCLDDIHQVTAFVGDVDRESGKQYHVNKYVQHRKWDQNKVHNDIALCRLKKPLSFEKSVKRLLLMKKPPKAKLADLAGWGSVDDKQSESVLLKHTKQKLWSYNQCRKVLTSPKGTICGGEKKARKDYASDGDSGSALLVNKNIMVGLVSYVDPSVSKSLIVYTDVAYFYDWIAKESKKLACSR